MLTSFRGYFVVDLHARCPFYLFQMQIKRVLCRRCMFVASLLGPLFVNDLLILQLFQLNWEAKWEGKRAEGERLFVRGMRNFNFIFNYAGKCRRRKWKPLCLGAVPRSGRKWERWSSANKCQGHAVPLRNLHKHIANPILVATSKDCKSREARTLAGIENSMWYRHRQLRAKAAKAASGWPQYSVELLAQTQSVRASSEQQRAASSQQPVWVVKMETQINIERGVVDDVVVFVAMEP